MRRFWIILMAISALSLVACGGEQSPKASESSQSSTKPAMPEYKQKALNYAIAVFEAENVKNSDKVSEISIEVAKYVTTLSDKHRKIFEKTYKEQYDLLANSESYLSDMVAGSSERHDNKKESQQTEDQWSAPDYVSTRSSATIVKEQPVVQDKTYIETVKGINMKMIYVESGTFMMGASSGDSDAYDREKPAHKVTLDSYYIAEFEVTQSQWQKIMGTTISEQNEISDWKGFYGVGSNYPMYHVNWDEADAFCKKLSDLTGRTYKLPTEAQWEFAARGGNKSRGYKYSGSNSIDAVAWYDDNSNSSAHPVGQKRANQLGLYDMSGNVWEWCGDYWSDSYSSSNQTNPEGPSSGQWRVLRGGGWYINAGNCRVSYRNCDVPSSRYSDCGFRVVCLP